MRTSHPPATRAPLDVVDATPVPLLPINAEGDTPKNAATHEPWEAAIDRQVASLPPGAPIVVMIHGYKHSPRRPKNSPHEHLLALRPRRGGRSTSWPKHLGFGRGTADEGLAIAFGWHARGLIWQAYREADAAGRALGAVISRLSLRYGRSVHILCHSLGARVALRALHDVPVGSVGRIVMLAGAEFTARATAAVSTPAGRSVEFLNVTSGENALFDGMFEWLLQAPWAQGRALGHGLSDASARWVDLAIDDPGTCAHLSQLGFRIRPRQQTVCHWSGYLRPGLFALYRAVLTQASPLPLHALRVAQARPQDRRLRSTWRLAG